MFIWAKVQGKDPGLTGGTTYAGWPGSTSGYHPGGAGNWLAWKRPEHPAKAAAAATRARRSGRNRMDGINKLIPFS